MSDYPMLISNKLHSFRNFVMQRYEEYSMKKIANVGLLSCRPFFFNEYSVYLHRSNL